MKQQIINKKTKEKFIILGFLAEMAQSYCVIANLKNKEIKQILKKELFKDYEYFDSN